MGRGELAVLLKKGEDVFCDLLEVIEGMKIFELSDLLSFEI